MGSIKTDDPIYETKKAEYIRNVAAPEAAYKIQQE